MLELPGDFTDGVAQDRLVQRVLGAEVMKHVGLADPGAFGNGAHGGRVKPVLGEQGFGRRQNAGDRVAAGTDW